MQPSKNEEVIPSSKIVGDNRLASHLRTQLARGRFLLFEWIAFSSAVLFLMIMLRDMLFYGQTTMTHDTVLWVYPIFTYLADGLLHGYLPLWNPFSRGGEPLLFSYLQTRLFDPIDYLVIYVGALFTNDLTTLFNWDRVARLLASALGTHLLLRRWAKHPATRIALAFISVLSTMTTNVFHQCGFLDQFYSAPFIGIFVFRILEGKRGWANWFAALCFLGPCLQSYFFVGAVTFILSIVLGYALFRRSHLVDLLGDRSTWTKISVCVIFLAVMSGPSLIMFLQQKDFYMSARTYDNIFIPVSWEETDANQISKSMIMMPYRFIRLTGSTAVPGDLLGLLAPNANDPKLANGANALKRVIKGAAVSDSRLFFGGLAFVISLIGISIARHPLKRVWLVVLVSFGTLMLGAYTPVNELLYWIYPPLWFIRHTQQFINFFLLALLFFFALGSDYLLAVCRPISGPLPGKKQYWLEISSWNWYSRLYGFALKYRFLTYNMLAIICLFIVYNQEESIAAVGALTSNYFVNVLAAFAMVQLALATLDHVLTIRRPVLGPFPDRELHWWRVSNWYWYSSFRNYVRKNRFQVNIFLALICSITIYSKEEGTFAFNAFMSIFVSSDPNNFTSTAECCQRLTYCVNVLAVAAMIQVPLAIMASRPFFRTIHLSIVWCARLFGVMASIIAISVFVTLPMMHTGVGIENISEGLFFLPRAINFSVAVTTLAAANLILAAMFFGTYFLAVLLISMTIVAAARFAEPAVLLSHVGLFIVFPAIVFLQLQRYAGRSSRKIVAALLILVTLTELFQLSLEFRPEIHVPRSSIKKDWPVVVGGQAFPDTRIAAIPDPPFSIDSLQVVRFSEVLMRRAVALDALLKYPIEPFVADTAHMLDKPSWNTFFMLTAYRDLISSGLPPAVIESIFGIGQPIFQFRQNARISNNFIADLQPLTPNGQLAALENSVFLDSATLPAGWRRPEPASLTGSDSPATLVAHSLSYDQASVTVDSGRAGFVYFVDAFTPDWTVTVNGTAAPVLRANGQFKAVQIEPGKSEIHFVYRPWALIWALRLFFGALSLAALMALVCGSWPYVRARKSLTGLPRQAVTN